MTNTSSPRQVDLMNKWKAVDTADEGLLSVRKQYQEKMVEFAERWSKVGAIMCFGVFWFCNCGYHSIWLRLKLLLQILKNHKRKLIEFN